MSSDLNMQLVCGNLVDDAKLTPVKGGERIAASFSLIANYSWLSASGEQQNHAERFNVKLYAAPASEEFLRNRLVKGARATVTGRTITEKYQKDGKDCYWRYVLTDMREMDVQPRYASQRDTSGERPASKPTPDANGGVRRHVSGPNTQRPMVSHGDDDGDFRDLCHF